MSSAISIVDVLRECISKIEASRRTMRGDKAALRLYFWTSFDQAIDELTNTPNISAIASTSLDREVLNFLFSVARSAATSSVKLDDRSLLRRGLVALAIEGGRHEERESLIELALLANSYRILRLDLLADLKELTAFCTPDFILMCEGIASNQSSAIASMGYIESTDAIGEFCYKQQW